MGLDKHSINRNSADPIIMSSAISHSFNHQIFVEISNYIDDSKVVLDAVHDWNHVASEQATNTQKAYG